MTEIVVGDIVIALPQYSHGSGTALHDDREYEVVEVHDHQYIVKHDIDFLNRSTGGGNMKQLILDGKTDLHWNDGYWGVKKYMVKFVRSGITGICVDCASTCKVDGLSECELMENRQ
jgi:hypothetical protein